MSAQSPVVEALHAASRVLAPRGSRWYVFGAQAVTIWGIPRMSADLDLTIELALDEVPTFVQQMSDNGFRLRISEPGEFVARTGVLPFEHSGSGLLVDVVVSGPGIEEEFHRRAVPVDVDGVQVPFISPEDLIVTKVLAGRPKDLDDVRGVLETRGATLDLDWVRTTLRLLEHALAQSDLVPAFEALAARVGS
jgi:hypothetical protein